MTERDRDFFATLQHIVEHPEKFVLLDTETTGLGTADQVIELGILGLDGTVLLDTLVRPTCRISPKATEVNGITEEQVAAAPSWAVVWRQAEPLLKGKRLIAYNAAFDVRMLKQSCRAVGVKEPFLRSLCLMEAVAAWRGCRTALSHFAKGPQRHRAVDDCRVMLEDIILAYYEKLSAEG